MTRSLTELLIFRMRLLPFRDNQIMNMERKTIQREEGWQKKLYEALIKYRNSPFKPGKHDCCFAICNVVKIYTGTDLAKSFRKYRTKKKIKNILTKYGSVESIADEVAKEYNIMEVPPLTAQRGDIVLVNGKDEDSDEPLQTLAVVGLDGWHVYGAGSIGWNELTLQEVIKAWHIE